MIKFDDTELVELQKDLKVFAKRSLPFATKNTINQTAFLARKIAQDNIRNKMTVRNRFTLNSIRVNQTKTLNISRQEALTGSTADYMETQEFGGIKTSKGKEGVPIATNFSAGVSHGAKPRTKLPKKSNRLGNIRLKRGRKRGQNQKQKNFLAIRQAAETSQKFIFLDLSKSKGIFKVVGGKRRPRIEMVQDMSNKAVTIKRNPWLKPAADGAQKQLPKIYLKSLQFQARRQGLFK